MRDNKTSTDSQNRGGRKQGGAALIIVVLTTLVVSALLGAMLIESNTEHLIAGNERDAERALEVSKAGLNYAYYLYENNLINPTTGGTAFNSYTPAVASSLDGGSFTGSFFDDSGVSGGQRYRIRSTGVFGTASRTVEMAFLLNSDALAFGFLGFDDVTLHRHNTKGATTFNISSTIASNNVVSVDPGLNIDGSIVSSGSAAIGSTSVVQGDVFSYSISNSGTIKGRAGLVTSVAPTSGVPSVTDNEGTKHIWYSGRSNPAATTKVGGTVGGGVSRYVVKNGDVFESNIFDPAGNLILNPPLNVITYIAPPRLDYRAMKTEADLHDATYFTTPALAVQYFAGKKYVYETIGGQTLTTIKVGTTTAPEFVYVVGALELELDPEDDDDYGGGTLKADGLHIEGGIYASGGFQFNGKGFDDPDTYPVGYHQLKINALPYCYPGVIAYSQPTTPKGGTIATWVPADTPAIGSGGDFSMSSSSGDYEGTTVINGLVYAQGDIHIHHTRADKELVTLRGAELAWKIHNCDFFNFVYDPQVACTKFLGMQGGGTPGVLSFREIR